ncbi:MAG: hypothetical protein IPL46_23105 [Saprospiraceae bacterium]|nr:hypothetical protein [Saprospiraceae bacterium]
MSEKELKQFILDQSNKSPLIAGELKAQFAHKIEVPNADDKYFYVIKNYTTALSQGKLNEQKFKKLTVYLSNLIHHGEDLCSAKNYREAALILLGLVKSMGIYAVRYRMLSWSELSGMVHKFLERLMKQELPPAFRLEIAGKLRSLYLQESYLIFDAKYNLFTQLYDFVPGQQLLIYREFTTYITSHYDRDHAVDACFAMATKQNDLSQLVLFAERHLQNLTVLRRFFEMLKAESIALAKPFIQHIYQHSKGSKTKIGHLING